MRGLGGYPIGPGGMRTESFPLLQVAGEGRLEVAPDTAEVLLGVSVRAEEATAAYEQGAAAASRVVAALMEMGIAQEQMQTQQIMLNPVYDRERLTGYEATTTLRVTLRDLAAVGPAADRAMAAGATIVHGVRFDVRDTAAHEAAALTAAVQDAQRKAAVLARSLGVTLGPVWRAEAEPSPGPVIPAMARAVGAEAMPVLPGTLTLTRTVQVNFLIRYV